MIKMRRKIYGPQIIPVYLYERRRFDPINNAEIRRARSHNTKITLQYVRVDNVLCLNGRYMAWNLSQDMKAAEISEACERKVSTVWKRIWSHLRVLKLSVRVHSPKLKPT